MADPISPSAQHSADDGTVVNGQDISDTLSHQPDNYAQTPTETTRASLFSPIQSSLHPLPPKPALASPLDTAMAIEASGIAQSSTPIPVQAQPRTRGGFEVDDEDEESVNDDEKDDVDVYEPTNGLESLPDTPAPHAELSIDRNAQSPKPEIGTTPLPVQASDSAAETSFTAVSSTNAALRASTATPVQAVLNDQVQFPSARSNVNGSIAPAVPKTRLAHDVVGILEDRIKEDPRGDLPAWLELIDELKTRNKQEDVRRTYDQFLDQFPLCAEQWCAYVKWEEQHDKKYEMEKIFQRCLLAVPNVELWSIYINYIRRRNSMQTGDVAKSYKIINESFAFALRNVGMDKDSGKLWQDYIDFLKSGPGVVGGTSWQDSQKMDTLRDAYQKAIAVPTAALQGMWKEYDSFETGLNKINGRKYLQDKSPSYMTARTALTQIQNMTRDLSRTSRPRLAPAMGYEGDIEFMQQVTLWKQWIQWEKDDPVVLKDEDISQYQGRVLFTYKQALTALYLYPELWYEAIDWCLNNGFPDEGLKLLKDGIRANPESPLLAFKLADRVEVSTSNDEAADPGAKSRMIKVREPFDKVLDALYELVKKVSTRESQEIQRIEVASEYTGNGVSEEDDINAGNAEAKKAALDAQITAVKQAAQVQVEMLSKIISHVWVALMRATRRIQGKGLPTERGASGFRTVFNDARKRGRLTSDFYVESAQIEWQCYRDATGTKILERGLKLFPEDDYLPLEYIKHLISINDVTNARAVFETTVNRLFGKGDSISLNKARPLFAFFHDYESKFGELSQVVRLEERIRQHFPDDGALQSFSSRFTTGRFNPVNVSPIVSPTQTQPKTGIQQSIEPRYGADSPIQKVIDAITTNSPKRPYPGDDSDDTPPRKIARGESPMKTGFGRRFDGQPQPPQSTVVAQASVPQFRMPAPLPPQVNWLLSVLPRSSQYNGARFIASETLRYIRDTHLPPPGSIPNQQPQYPQPPQAQHPPASAWPPQQYGQHTQHLPPPVMPQGYMPPQATQAPYSTAPFRYA